MAHPDATDLLLHACLARHDDAARAAFERWQQVFDLDDIDGSGFPLLPLLEARLAQLGVDHPWRGRLQGVVRKARLGLTLDRASAHAALEALRRANIDAMLLSASFDVPLLLEDVTLYVLPRRARTARDVLISDQQWDAQKSDAAIRSRWPLHWRSAMVLGNTVGRRITLRWQLLDARPSQAIDEEMCARAVRRSAPQPTVHFDAADFFVQATLRHPTTLRSTALACLAYRRCDGAARERIHSIAEALGVHNSIAHALRLCEAVFEGAPLPPSASSPLVHMREALRRRLAYVTLNSAR